MDCANREQQCELPVVSIARILGELRGNQAVFQFEKNEILFPEKKIHEKSIN